MWQMYKVLVLRRKRLQMGETDVILVYEKRIIFISFYLLPWQPIWLTPSNVWKMYPKGKDR